MAGRIAIVKYMQAEIEDHIDNKTGEVDFTELARDACDHFDDYDANYEIPEKYYEYAYEVATRYEIKTGVIDGKISGLSGLINSKDSSWF